MSSDEDAQQDLFRPNVNHNIDVLVRTERLGGATMTAGKMRELGFPKTLSEVDRTQEDVRSDVEMMSSRLVLPSVVVAEALSIAYALPKIHGSSVRERAIFCVYVAGKRHGCVTTDISSISRLFEMSDPKWTRGRILRSIGLIQDKLPEGFLERFGRPMPTSIETYIAFIFKSLGNQLPRAEAGLQTAYAKAMEILAKSRASNPEALSGRSPRAHAAYVSYLAIREVEWARLGVSQRDIVWTKEIMRASDVSKKSVTSQRSPKTDQP